MAVNQPGLPLNVPAYGFNVPARAYHGSFAQSRRNLCAQSRNAISIATIPQSTPQCANSPHGLLMYRANFWIAMNELFTPQKSSRDDNLDTKRCDACLQSIFCHEWVLKHARLALGCCCIRTGFADSTSKVDAFPVVRLTRRRSLSVTIVADVCGRVPGCHAICGSCRNQLSS